MRLLLIACLVPGCGYESSSAPKGDMNEGEGEGEGEGGEGEGENQVRGCPWGAGTLPEVATAVLEGGQGSVVGETITFVGDLDGDGLDDLALPDREHRRESEHSQRGAVHLFYGRVDLPPVQALDDEVLLEGDAALGDAEISVAGGGDLDGDGLPDLLVGTQRCVHGSEAGRVTIVYGGDRLVGSLTFGDAGSVLLDDVPCGRAGANVAILGDLDGDGHDDFGVTGNAGRVDSELDQGLGRLYVFYGGAGRLPASAELAASADAIVRPREGSSYFGHTLAAAGDVDGDGFADLLVTEDDRVWLVHGGPRLAGEAAIDDVAIAIEAGYAFPVAALGDLDEDGLADFAIGGAGGELARLFYGDPDRFDQSLDAEDADAILERTEGSRSGPPNIAAAGDVDGEGHADLIAGDPALGNDEGGAFLLLGDGDRLGGSMPLSDLARPLRGIERSSADEPVPDRAGSSVAGGGDLDGDGLPDLVVGAPTTWVGGDLGGRVFVLTCH